MTSARQETLDNLWANHNGQWRDSMQVSSQWLGMPEIDPKMLRYTVSGAWWETVAALETTLIVTREYEHLVVALCLHKGKPRLSYVPLPHPSGLAFDSHQQIVHIAATRNPNQVFDFAPIENFLSRCDVETADFSELLEEHPLTAIQSRFYPGCFYMHDLAFIGDKLHANSVGQNAVVRLEANSQAERVWWPRCIETSDGPVFGQNYIQLNSIAAGNSLANSYFTASTDKLSARRPGHKNFPVDRRGVIFSGASHEAVVRGLTRPHSARLHARQVWVDNSGYGELGYGEDGQFRPIVRLPGWTRGLGISAEHNVAIVGTSRVIPRFRQYAPGLDVDNSRCGLHAIDLKSGNVLGSLYWPYGNQIFAIELLPRRVTSGFVFEAGSHRHHERERRLFYSFLTRSHLEHQDQGNHG